MGFFARVKSSGAVVSRAAVGGENTEEGQTNKKNKMPDRRGICFIPFFFIFLGTSYAAEEKKNEKKSGIE